MLLAAQHGAARTATLLVENFGIGLSSVWSPPSTWAPAPQAGVGVMVLVLVYVVAADGCGAQH